MDEEFHYYITALIARTAGWEHEDALKIATSSQFVDDNKDLIVVYGKSDDAFVSKITQCYDILVHAQNDLENLYVRFHFLPSFEGKQDSYITQENSKIAQYLMCKAVESQNPFLIGIAAHAYADTFAHQHFSGLLSHHNAPSTGLPPAYGHTYYGELPDLVGGVWFNVRQGIKVVNNERFINAAVKLLDYLGGSKPDYLADMLGVLYSSCIKTKRIKMYRKLYEDKFKRVLPYYAKQKWLNGAVHKRGSKYYKRHNFEESEWYKFQLSIIDYGDIFAQYLYTLSSDAK